MPAARRVWTCPFPPSMELRVDGLIKSPHMQTADGRMDRSNDDAEVADAASVVALGPSVERNVRSFGRFDRLYTSFMETRRSTMSPTSAAVDVPELAAAPAADARDRRNVICFDKKRALGRRLGLCQFCFLFFIAQHGCCCCLRFWPCLPCCLAASLHRNTPLYP